MRLIDADVVIPKGTAVTDDVIAVHKALSQAPTVDAVPVVRCKDCDLQYGCKVGQYLGDDGFCSCGERRSDG
jgi:hypothetical protein